MKLGEKNIKYLRILVMKKLASKAKKFNFDNAIVQMQICDIGLFMENCFRQHEKESNFNNDISFAYYVCSNIIDYILECIINNSFNGKYISKII